ncbi:hypothetical protein A9Q83_10610 [Alphaproteobacteria bacterium 46_93_T64]|nr:hypothetical protein A9Q83_10610 [Alphaproteobacteria bacterium 46_93_T64]
MNKQSKAYVIGTCDTKEVDLIYVRDLIASANPELDTVLVDISTRPIECAADVKAIEVAMHHPDGPSSVFIDDRGLAVKEMGRALETFISTRSDVGGIIGLGGSGGTGMIAPAMQTLPIGIPKILVSTLASGDVSAYVGPCDINMFHSVTDVAGINRVSSKVLANAAHALAGMMRWKAPEMDMERDAVALTMFGVTTTCVLSLVEALEKEWDCLVFHATGTGGRSMEKLVAQGDVSAVIDITTTEICDLIIGGMLSAGEGRLDSIAQTGVPYVGSCGALDMANFWGRDTVPAHFKDRNFYIHNEQVTLMRSTADEAEKIGVWIGRKLNNCNGPVRFLLPELGMSALDVEGGPFYDIEANAALFRAIEDTVVQTDNRQVIRINYHINSKEFAVIALKNFKEITAK